MSHETTISSITPSQPRRCKTHSFAFWRRLGLCWFMSLTLIVQSKMPPVTKAEVRPPAAAPVSSAPTPPPAAAQGNVDLSVTALDTAAVVTDSQTLMISGALSVTINNMGSDAVNAAFSVIAFEDRNSNGAFNQGTDLLLGSTDFPGGVGANASTNLSIALSGIVTFKGNLIYVLVDSQNAIAETNEGNNILSTGGVAAPSMVVIPYAANGYRYRVVSWGEGAGFEQPGFDDSGFAVGTGGFGVGCGGFSSGTAWPLNTDILVRKKINLSSTTSNLIIKGAIDNDVQVFVNGQSVGNMNSIVCASPDSFMFNVPRSILRQGENVIAARGHDYGNASYLDLQVTAEFNLFPDLNASLIRKNDALFPASSELIARIGNGGGVFVPPGVYVSFYNGDPAAGGTLIGTTQTTISLNPGQYEDVKVVWNNPPTGLHPITVVADDNGSGQGTVTEGNEANNKAMANIALGIGPFTLVDDLIARFKDSAVDLRWSPIAGAVGYNVYRRTGNGAPQLIKQAHPRASYADSVLTNGTTYYYTVRWVNASGIESGDGTEMSATPTAQANRSDVPPTILSAPVTRTVANQPYSYDVNARDPNAADALSYALPTPAPQALAGMTVNTASGLIEWASGFANAGYQNVTVRVEDSRGRVATQTYRLFVEIPNSPPVVNAGADQTVILAAGSNLTGAVLDDGLPFGSTLTTAWSKVSGPGTVTFANPGTATTTAAFSTPGSYVLRLTASDSQFSRNDEVTVFVVSQLASRIYTLNSDFDAGQYNNVVHSIPHQLQLAERNIGAVEVGPGSCPSSTWPAEGNANDTSGVNNGTLKDGATFAPGYTGQAFSLDGSSAYVEVPINTPAFNFPVSFTWEAWINPTSLANNPVVFSKEDGINNRAGLQILPDGSLCSFTNSGFCAAISAPGLISTCAFTKVTLLYDGSTNNLATYVNGSQVSSATVAATYNNSAPFNIGWSPFGLGNTHFPGRIDEVSFSSCMVPPTPSQSFVTGSCNTGSPDSGTWTVVFDSQIANAEWGRIGWNAQVCGDGALTVTAASSTDNTTFSAAQNVTRGQDLTVPDGRYLRISVLFRRATTGESPILYDLSVGTEGYAPPPQTNTPPTVDAGTDLSTALFVPVKLKGTACDDGLPTGTLSFTWSKVSGPGAVTFANANALATTATINTPGAYVLRLTVSDGASTVSDDINVTIEGTNSPPVISSTAPTSTCSTRPYSYQVIATDPNFGDLLTYSLPTAPAGMTINAATGLIQWTPSAGQIGSHSVTVRVVDLGNNQAEQNFTVNVAATPATNTAPTITSTAPTAGVVSLLYTYQAAATDPDPCETLAWSLDVAPAGMTINSATGLIQWTPSAAQTGNQNVTVRARDFSGASSTQSFIINVGPPDNTPPVVAIASPAAGSTLSADVPVIGSVSDANLQSWALEYQVSGGSNWVTLATGTTPVNNVTLATFPVTLLANNAYILRLRASDPLNQNETFREVIVNSGNLKLGAFTLAYEDLKLPGVGVPISIRRFYDSRRTEAGDFGPGWTLGFSNVDIRTDASQNVFITLPNGRRTAFAFLPQLVGFFPIYTNRYVAPAGVYDTLENTDSPFLYRSGGQWFDLDFSPYNPQNYILRTKEGLTYTLSATGGIRKIEDRNGRFIEITPNGVTSSTGRNVVFTRNAAGLITQISDPSNNTLRYDYDAADRLVKFTDQLNLATNYSYYGSGHYIKDVLTPGGCRPLRTEYDADGRVKAKEDNAGNRSTYSYDQVNRTETITNPLTQTAVYKYDTRGNLLEVRDPLNQLTVYTYDANNNNLSITFPSGRTITQTFDNRGNILTRSESPQAGVNLTTSYTYNSFDYVDTVTKPLGDKIKFIYDVKSNLTRREYRAANDSVVSADSFTYDAQGNQASWTDGEGKLTQYIYNSFGEVVERRTPSNAVTRYEYDANGNSSAFIDGLGNRTEFVYNGFNLLAQTKHGGQTLSSVTYSDLNKPATMTDALGRVTTYGYDCQGNLIQVTDPEGGITRYQIDALANLKRITDARNNQTSYLYDDANRQTTRTGADNQVWGNGYTPDSYIQTTITPNGTTIQLEYDNMGRVTREIRPEKIVEYSYADCCRQSQVIERIGAVTRTTNFNYDGIGRLASITDPSNRTINYTYNGRGQRTSMTTPDGVTTSYLYDDAGRVFEVRIDANWARFTYDGTGRRTRTLYSNGASNNYNYNTRGHLTNVVIRDSIDTVIASYAYTLDANGNRIGATYHDGSASYVLDTLDRLTSETVNSASLGSFNQSYSYDAVGNRLNAGATFSADNRLVSDAGGTYSYDNNGNLIVRGNQSYGYDGTNRLVSFSKPGAIATYQYDYLNRRIAKTLNGTTQEFLYDGDHLSIEYLGGSLVAHYTYGTETDEILMLTRDGQTFFCHADGLGSVVAITNGTGQVVHRYGYDAFGNIHLNNGLFAFTGSGLVNNLTFTGREYDEELNAYHLRARTYDPSSGRFLQKDPLQGSLGLPQSQNLYSYVFNNPLNNVDPTGETVLLGYVQILGSRQNEVAAAAIGGIYGYALTNVQFLANYLGGNDSLGPQARWKAALEDTEKDLKNFPFSRPLGEKISTTESCVTASANVRVGLPGVVNSFYSGANLIRLRLPIVQAGQPAIGVANYFGGQLSQGYARFFFFTAVDIAAANPNLIEANASLSIGGWNCGSGLALDRLRTMQPQ